MNYKNILSSMHIVAGNGVNVVYDMESMNLLKVNNLTYKILEALKKGMDVTEIEAKYQTSGIQISRLLESLNSGKECGNSPLCPPSERTVERITLHVSNDCKLRCKYCYANGGSYNQNRALMSLETAEQFVDFCSENFDKVGFIVFFGGEPLLNVPVMKYICAEFSRRHTHGLIKFMPEFGMITNGTLLNDDILHFIRDNLSFVTVSIDGIGEMNDANRIFANGKGSYPKIQAFIHTLKTHTKVHIRYEATYTQYHIDKGISTWEVSQGIENEFGITGEVIEELSVQNCGSQDFWHDFSFEKWKQEGSYIFPEGFWSILDAINQKRPKLMCGIAHTIFAVATNGDIYPCHINTGEPSNRLGNISGTHIFNSPQMRQARFPVNVEHNETCKSCWANKICGGCSRTWFYDEEKKKYLPSPKSELCQKNKQHLENILLLMAAIRSDAALWKELVEKSKRTGETAKLI